MPQIKLYLLGTFELTLDGQPVPSFRSDKTRALLAYLTLNRAQPMTRTQLLHLFWPGYQLLSARASLRSSLSNLRQVLLPLQLIGGSHRTVRLQTNHTNFWCDLLALEEAVNQQQPAAATAWVTALKGRPVGEFLQDLVLPENELFQNWVQVQRSRIRPLLATLLANLPATTVQTEVVRSARSPAVQVQGAERPQPPRPLSQLHVTQLYFASAPPLVGRQPELADLSRQLLQTGCQPIFLTGPSGVGKTRLALVLAEQLQAHFHDGCWLISLATKLAANSEAESLAATIGHALALPLQPDSSLGEQLVDHLRQRQLLLVLDDLRDNLRDLTLLQQLTQAAPEVRVLITAEHSPPSFGGSVISLLGLPGALSPLIASSVSQLPSDLQLQLFREEAQRCGLAWPSDALPMASIVRIGQLLAGLPLGLCLAAALWARLDLVTIVTSLEYAVQSLSGTPTHSNANVGLTALLELIWEMLTPHQQQGLIRLTVFPACFSQHSAVRVAMISAQGLADLVERRLLWELKTEATPLRHEFSQYYCIPKAVRRFVMQKGQSQPGFDNEARRRFCSYYATTELTPELLRREGHHLQLAWRWATEDHNVTLLERLQPRLQSLRQLWGREMPAQSVLTG